MVISKESTLLLKQPKPLSWKKASCGLGVLLLVLLLLVCAFPQNSFAQCDKFGSASLVGQLPPEVDESSGLVASRKNPGVWWTHNDSGGAAAIFAMDATGKLLARFDVKGATNRDWEDIAAAPCPNGDPCLYIGDIGDNNKRYSDIKIYRIPEPTVVTGTVQGTTEQAEVFTLQYPNGARNAEAFFVHPTSRDIIIVTKEFAERCEVYMLPGNTMPSNATLTRVGDLDGLGDLVTGGDISPDGKTVALRFYTKAALYNVGSTGIPTDANRIQILTMPATKQSEAIAFSTDGLSLFSTSEGKGSDATFYKQVCTATNNEPTKENTPEPSPEPIHESKVESTNESSPERPNETVAEPPQDAASNESIVENKESTRETNVEANNETAPQTGCAGCSAQTPLEPAFFLLVLFLVSILYFRRQQRSRREQKQ